MTPYELGKTAALKEAGVSSAKLRAAAESAGKGAKWVQSRLRAKELGRVASRELARGDNTSAAVGSVVRGEGELAKGMARHRATTLFDR